MKRNTIPHFNLDKEIHDFSALLLHKAEKKEL